MRVFSFQSQEVLDILLRDGVYKPDWRLCREGHGSKGYYDEDGGPKVWVFAKPDICYNSFVDGLLMKRWHDEFGFGYNNKMSDYLFLELEIDENKLQLGHTHNAYMYSKVTEEIELSQLYAVYRVYMGDDNDDWERLRIIPEKIYNHDNMFRSGLDAYCYTVMEAYCWKYDRTITMEDVTDFVFKNGLSALYKVCDWIRNTQFTEREFELLTDIVPNMEVHKEREKLFADKPRYDIRPDDKMKAYNAYK
jgi:hypothetical protein